MVAPCCRFCYEKYINEDETLDRQFIKKNVFSNYNVLKRPTDKIITMSLSDDNQVSVPIDTVVTLVVDGQEHEFCTCRCHVKGQIVRH